MHDIDQTQLEWSPESGAELMHQDERGALGEAQELELTSQLLEVQSEQELEQFLGDLFRTVGSAAGRFVRSDTGRALGGILKDAARQALPVVGSAIGSAIRPDGGAAGASIAQQAGTLMGLELEGLSRPDQEFEVARHYVRFAGNAYRRAALGPRNVPPGIAARMAAMASARRWAPGLRYQLAGYRGPYGQRRWQGQYRYRPFQGQDRYRPYRGPRRQQWPQQWRAPYALPAYYTPVAAWQPEPEPEPAPEPPSPPPPEASPASSEPPAAEPTPSQESTMTSYEFETEGFEYGSQEAEYGEPGEMEMGELESPLQEVQEMEAAAHLLEITNEQELEEFLGDLFKGVARTVGGVIRSPVGRALGGILKGVAKKALPVVGGALGSIVAPGVGTAIGSQLGSMASNLFELELEGMEAGEAEFEVARRYVQLAATAAQNAALAPPDAPPGQVAQHAVAAAAQRYAPGLLSGATTNGAGGGQHRSGRWVRRGRKIVLYGV